MASKLKDQFRTASSVLTYTSNTRTIVFHPWVNTLIEISFESFEYSLLRKYLKSFYRDWKLKIWSQVNCLFNTWKLIYYKRSRQPFYIWTLIIPYFSALSRKIFTTSFSRFVRKYFEYSFRKIIEVFLILFHSPYIPLKFFYRVFILPRNMFVYGCR